MVARSEQTTGTVVEEVANTPKPAIPSELPDRPWQKVAADLFEFKDQHYLLVIDYFSHYVEVARPSRTTSPDLVMHLKSMFARHGIPDLLLSDNGSQFSANTFSKFQEVGFTHIHQAPIPLSKWRGRERCSDFLKKALMAYRTTPLESGLSSAELLMGRKIRTTVNILPSQLEPSGPCLEQFREKDSALKPKQRKNFDTRHFQTSYQEILSGYPAKGLRGQ